MINNKKPFHGTFFTCDQCGKEYSFSNSFLTVSKGQEFCPFEGETQTAACDLCRDCAGQTAKFLAGGETKLQSEIAVIDAATAKRL